MSINGYDTKYLRHSYVSKDIEKTIEDIVENYPNAFIPKSTSTLKNSHTCKDIEDLVENFALPMVSETNSNDKAHTCKDIEDIEDLVENFALPMVNEKDPVAISLGYKSYATTVDKKKYPKYGVGQNCSNCALYQGKIGETSGGCPLYAGKAVSSKGWCSAYAKKA